MDGESDLVVRSPLLLSSSLSIVCVIGFSNPTHAQWNSLSCMSLHVCRLMLQTEID